MNNSWLSDNLSTQNWMIDRTEFLFTCLTSRLSDYYQGQVGSQLQYGQALYAVAQELAKLDAYGNFLFDQGSVNSVDPGFFHITEAPLFNLNSSIPAPTWSDSFYKNFLIQLERLFVKPSTTSSIKTLAGLYFSDPTSLTNPEIQIAELTSNDGRDNPYSIQNQHVVDVRVPQGWPLDSSLTAFLNIVDELKPAHVMVRFITDPMGRADYIHGATIKDPFYFKYCVTEARIQVTLLSWAVLGISGTNKPTWFDPMWFDLLGGLQSSDTQVPDLAQIESGVFAPAILPSSRYRVGDYYFASASQSHS